MAKKINYKSQFEKDFSKRLSSLRLDFSYESESLEYTLNLKYKPDFILSLPKGQQVILETKGKFPYKDRQKMLAVKEAHPDLDIRLVFMSATEKIAKGSSTTYGDWATKNGFKWWNARRGANPITKEWILNKI